MKKIFTLASALVVASTSVVCATSTTNLPTGYYTIKSTATGDNFTHLYLFNDAASTIVSSNGMKASERTLLAQSAGTTNNYYWHIVNNGGSTVTIVNGQGTPLVYEDGNHGATKVYSTNTLTPVDANSTYTTAVYFSQSFCTPQKTDTNHNYGDYLGINLYANHVGNDTKWCLTKSDDEKVFYTVTVTGNTKGYVTRTLTSADATTTTERAYNTGFFVLDSGTALQESELTVAAIDGYTSSVSVNNETHTVTVTYIVQKAVLQEAVTSAKAVEAKTGVGYPTSTNSTRTALKTAIATAEAALSNEATTDYVTPYNALQSAVIAFKNATTDIQMPEDGHTYVFTNVQPNGTRRYYNYASSGCTMVARGTGAAEELPQSAKFTCRVVGSTYVFVNNEGKYLSMKKDGNGTGFKDSYDATYNPMTFKKMTTSTWTTSASSNADLFGFVCFGGRRSDNSNSSFFVIKNGGGFDYANLTNTYYNSNFSNAFEVEEVSYPNIVTFNAATGIDNIEKIATFSAPFATIVPSGVTAWYADNVGEEVHLQSISDGQAIPAGQGVLLTAADDVTTKTMLPATSETAATISTNVLGNTAGQSKTLTDDMNAYILTKDPTSQNTAFCKGRIGSTLKMNKAYLNGNASSTAQALKMVFDNETTGITTIDSQEKAYNAPIFDLTGRRVMKTNKGHLYIQNGHKFIAE